MGTEKLELSTGRVKRREYLMYLLSVHGAQRLHLRPAGHGVRLRRCPAAQHQRQGQRRDAQPGAPDAEELEKAGTHRHDGHGALPEGAERRVMTPATHSHGHDCHCH